MTQMHESETPPSGGHASGDLGSQVLSSRVTELRKKRQMTLEQLAAARGIGSEN